VQVVNNTFLCKLVELMLCSQSSGEEMALGRVSYSSD